MKPTGCFFGTHFPYILFDNSSKSKPWRDHGARNPRENKAQNLAHYSGVSENRGIPKWMVKIMETPIKMGWFGGKPTIFGNIHIDIPNYFLQWLLYTSFYYCTCFLQKQVHTARLEEVGQKNKFLNWSTFFWFHGLSLKHPSDCNAMSHDKKTSFSVVSNTINQPTWALHYVASSLSVLSPQIIAPKTNNNHGPLRNSHQE